MGEQGISLVTGGTGFIGRHLVQALLEQGQSVRVLDISPTPEIFNGKVDVWTGSILDKDLTFNAMQGVSIVYHLAAIPHLWSLNPEDFYRVNEKGTRIVVEAALHCGLKKFIYTSSETVLRAWKNHDPQPITESMPLPRPEDLPGPYSRSKLLAEHQVLRAIKNGLPGVIVYPTIPIGAGDVNLTPPTRMIRDFLNGQNLAYLECDLNLIPVKAVVEGHIAAANLGSPGERYILGQDNVKMSELLQLIEQQLGRKMPKRRIPYPLALLTARTMEYAARISKRTPAASIEGVRLAGTNMTFDCHKARKELGLPQYSLPHALEETADWLMQQGLVT